ncbi:MULTISPECIES: DUF4360 domain-containing protein [Actinomadura]|uniref:DUF4360 domain-containing protein n=1 Tax=Actinomadura litoris TaxID=2678616 RepID=A0A7K1L569_9ACTN|nr:MULTISPECIES: DUF4360 domain-containing protein [Actinomadura]MBT2212595.1 DUF4360 domain-containing protein [Actinomadura sp. NEAU-AAG7]MUN39571.1 DUF4360 domain-containing protein [Actinomadura litoris]
MRKGIAISASALAMTATAAVAAPPATASAPYLTRGPSGVTIELATVNGSGCPLGTAAVAVSDDKEAFTVTYSNYLVQVGGNSNSTDFRKNCQLNMKVHVPQGFTYAILSADYRGFAQLEPGASGLEKASYYFQGMPTTGRAEHTLKGEYSDNWTFTDVNDVAQLVYKPCGEERNFNINTELRVNKGTSDPTKVSMMAMDSTDTSIKTTYHFAWKKCP